MSGLYGAGVAAVFATQDLDPDTVVTDVDPTVNDDVTKGYRIGTHWINTAAVPQRVFICVKNDAGAADWDRVNSPSGSGVTYGEQYVYTDTANKVIGPLSNTPVPVGGLSLFPITGPIQKYSTDYTVREVAGGSAPGYYVCISPTSTAPGGGAFAGGANPSVGIDTVLASGDDVRVIYPA
jgi:hypothetical protein